MTWFGMLDDIKIDVGQFVYVTNGLISRRSTVTKTENEILQTFWQRYKGGARV